MKVFIVDDHPLFVAGIRALLEAEADITIIGEAGNGREAVEKIRKKTPDVVIMDISMPDMDGIEATRQILKEQNDIKIIALSIHTGKRYIKEMLGAGATGYLVKDSAPEELVQALKKVAKGEMYLSSAITSIALEKDDTGAEEMRDTDSTILRTKLHRPSISDDIVIRTGIIQQLEENKSRPLTLVSAGAGYGKSIAVSQWLESTTSQHSWLTLDEEHNDLRIFLKYFISAVERIFPSQLRETSSLIQTAELPSLPVISQILINELDGIDQEFILVLDDYHRIEQESIHNLIDELLHFPPENVNLTLISRRDPPLRLSNLRAHGRINEIRIDQLCFTTFEINSLFKNLYGMELDDRLAESVLKKTEGWIAGLRLTALLVSNADDMERLLASMKGDSRLVSEFLVEEVLLKQPVHIQDYLMNISIFERFCADLIDAVNVSEIPDQKEKISGGDFIELLVKSNLFIMPLDDQNEWYRYHHLLQELLLRRLKDNRNGKEIAELHSRASDWFVSRGFIDNAIRHTLAAEDPVKAAEIIEQHRHAELNRDRWYVVLRWLDMIPDEIKQQRIALMLTHVFLLFEQFRLLEMIPVLEQIDTMLSGDATDPGLRAEAKFCHAYILIYLNGDGEAALKLLQEAKEEIPENYEMIRAEIELCLAMARQMSGHGEEAIKSLEKKIRTENSPGGMIYSRLLTGLVFLYLHMGNLELANAAAKRLEIFAEQENLAYIRVFAQYAKANINLNSFDLEGAVKDIFIGS